MNQQQKPDPRSGIQSDLAEGELDTVEESLRIHEEKGDLLPDSEAEKEDAA
jgi:hypothetical protein